MGGGFIGLMKEKTSNRLMLKEDPRVISGEQIDQTAKKLLRNMNKTNIVFLNILRENLIWKACERSCTALENK